jgi:hypothetical protein
MDQISCHSYSVPEHIQEHIDLITPTVHFNHAARSEPMHKRSNDRSRMGQPSAHTGPKTLGQKVKITPNLENCDQCVDPSILMLAFELSSGSQIHHARLLEGSVQRPLHSNRDQEELVRHWQVRFDIALRAVG